MSILPIITIKKVQHKGSKQLLIQFAYNEGLISLVRQLKGALWSKSHKSWYIQATPENSEAIIALFTGKAVIHKDLLTAMDDKKAPRSLKRPRILSNDKRTLLNGYYKFLKGRRYSKSTISTYTNLIADFIEFVDDAHLDDIGNSVVDLYLANVFAPKNYAISTQRQFVSALKLFKQFRPECQIEATMLKRPKRDRKLPTVLSKEEVVDLLRHAKNLKHRAILALIYSAGLRISELLNLELRDIHIDRKQLYIKNAKGRKDRYVILADSFIPLLKNYYTTYRPDTFFVEGPNGGRYSAGSVRKFLKRYCKAAGIQKVVTPHTLRHSYATHLLENGVDLRYIQELLGHAKPETTMIYTHVRKKDLMFIESPLDTALKGLLESDKDTQKVIISGKLDQ